MEISYSAGLAERNSAGARDMYVSSTYSRIFPRRPNIREDQNTKQFWVNEEGGHYYSAGSEGTITGIGCDDLLIDDPLKAGDAD